MNVVEIAQLTGTISIFLLFCLQFYIGANTNQFKRVGRIALLWTSVYVFFLFFLRLLGFLNIGTLDDLRIISGFSSTIPLIAVIVHLWLKKRMGFHEPYQL